MMNVFTSFVIMSLSNHSEQEKTLLREIAVEVDIVDHLSRNYF